MDLFQREEDRAQVAFVLYHSPVFYSSLSQGKWGLFNIFIFIEILHHFLPFLPPTLIVSSPSNSTQVPLLTPQILGFLLFLLFYIHTHMHTHLCIIQVYKYNLMCTFNVVYLYMILRLIPWHWVTNQGTPGENNSTSLEVVNCLWSFSRVGPLESSPFHASMSAGAAAIQVLFKAYYWRMMDVASLPCLGDTVSKPTSFLVLWLLGSFLPPVP